MVKCLFSHQDYLWKWVQLVCTVLTIRCVDCGLHLYDSDNLYSLEQEVQNVLNFSSCQYSVTVSCRFLCKSHTCSVNNGMKFVLQTAKLWGFSSTLGSFPLQWKQMSKSAWNRANRCHCVCVYCGHDFTSFWNDVQKCNRTENGSEEVELSHQLAGLKTTQ